MVRSDSPEEGEIIDLTATDDDQTVAKPSVSFSTGTINLNPKQIFLARSTTNPYFFSLYHSGHHTTDSQRTPCLTSSSSSIPSNFKSTSGAPYSQPWAATEAPPP